MARMSSQQIKKALAPMFDFAKAVTDAADIAASAEESERVLADLAGNKQAIIDEINTLRSQVPKFKNDADAALTQLRTQQSDLQLAQTATFIAKRDLVGLENELIAGRAKIDLELRAFSREADTERAKIQKSIESKQQELSAVTDAFEQWKRDHGI